MTCYVTMGTVNCMAKGLQNGRLLVNDPFVGKLYHFAINHASGLRLNKKAKYIFSQLS
jgi:hypothetical protein